MQLKPSLKTKNTPPKHQQRWRAEFPLIILGWAAGKKKEQKVLICSRALAAILNQLSVNYNIYFLVFILHLGNYNAENRIKMFEIAKNKPAQHTHQL